jgi:transcriptional regulator with XRE-family HTH domain
MVITAYFDDTPRPTGTPREPRRKLLFEAKAARGSGSDADVRVHNISATGLLFECQIALKIGERIEIDLPHAGAIGAKIIWTSGNLFGCEFDAPISAATLSAAQLRGAVGGDVDIPPRQRSQADESFGVRLHRLRTERGLTLSQIAIQLGVSKPTVWAWEQGKARPLDNRIEALAQTLGVSSSELLPGRDTPAVRELITKAREQIAAAFGLSPDKVRITIDL